MRPGMEDELRLRLVDVLESMPDAFTAIASDWRILYVNATTLRLMGVTRDAMIGRKYFDAVPRSIGTEFETALRRAMANREHVRVDAYFAPRREWYTMDIHPLPNGDLAVYAIDTTARNLAEQARAQVERERDALLARLQLQFDSMPLVCVLCDAELKILDWNRAAERVFGYRHPHAVGRQVQELLMPMPQIVPAPNRPAHFVSAARTHEGRYITCEWHTAPVRDADGKQIGTLLIGDDITARRDTEAALRTTRAKLADIERVAAIGTWSWDLANDEITWSDESYRILGYAPGHAEMRSFRGRIHPDDVDKIWRAMRQSVDDHQPFRISWRALHQDGTIHHEQTHAYVELDAVGRPQRIVGTIQDVTERTLARQALADELAAMTRLHELSTKLVASDDPRSLLQDICDAAIAVTAADKGAIRLIDRETGLLIRAASRGFVHALLDDTQPVEPALLRGRVVIEDFSAFADARYVELATRHGIMSGQCTPLISRSGQLVGALMTYYQSKWRPDDRDLRVLDLLGRQAADWIERHQAQVERENLLAREREAREHAEHAAKVKDDFLATLSHELRTPLTAIVAWTDLIKLDPTDVEQLMYGIELIRRNALAQAQLVGDLLDLSRIVTGKMRLEVRKVDVVEVMHDALAAVRPACDAKLIQLRHAIESGLEPLQADPGRLRQILWNLMSNAVKFTPEGGVIDVAIARADSHLELRVSDTGVGISAPFLPHLFERFRQADASASRTHGGLGIGLALVKELTEAHGGQVRAYSDGEGKGATFVVRLPIVLPASTSRRPRTDPPRTAGERALEQLGGIRVLLVEDDEDALDVITRILHTRGALVTGAASAAEALRLLGEQSFDVLLSDIGLPRCDGYELIAEIRRRQIFTPAAALTAFAQEEDRERALAAGFHAYVAKPVEIAELVATVASLHSTSTSP